MVFKNFRLNCLIRVILLGLTIYTFFYLLFNTDFIATTAVVGLASIYMLFSLIHYVERTNRDLKRFLDAIQFSDSSQTFTTSLKGSSFEELSSSFNKALVEFQKVKMEKEEHYRCLQTVLQHVGMGLVSFKSDGEIDLINNAAKRMLRIPQLRYIQQVDTISEGLSDKFFKMKRGGKILVKVSDRDELQQLSVYATEFVLQKQLYKLISVQDIQSELEEKEMDAWQNLIRVLTHEIMNSITPISSLASTAHKLLEGTGINTENSLADVSEAVETIEKRSDGLIDFVDNYRKLTRVPTPHFEIVKVNNLFRRVKRLMTEQIEHGNIGFGWNIEPDGMEMIADPVLIEQVLINLCKNAVEAVRGVKKPRIELRSRIGRQGGAVIEVFDNGRGLDEEMAEKIFIPFFTTKKEGSGIGLSLSRQIMRLHKGSIKVSTDLKTGTVFTVKF